MDTIQHIGGPFHNAVDKQLLYNYLGWKDMAHRLVRDNYSTTKRFLKDFFTTLLGGTGGFGVDDRE